MKKYSLITILLITLVLASSTVYATPYEEEVKMWEQEIRNDPTVIKYMSREEIRWINPELILEAFEKIGNVDLSNVHFYYTYVGDGEFTTSNEYIRYFYQNWVYESLGVDIRHDQFKNNPVDVSQNKLAALRDVFEGYFHTQFPELQDEEKRFRFWEIYIEHLLPITFQATISDDESLSYYLGISTTRLENRLEKNLKAEEFEEIMEITEGEISENEDLMVLMYSHIVREIAKTGVFINNDKSLGEFSRADLILAERDAGTWDEILPEVPISINAYRKAIQEYFAANLPDGEFIPFKDLTYPERKLLTIYYRNLEIVLSCIEKPAWGGYCGDLYPFFNDGQRNDEHLYVSYSSKRLNEGYIDPITISYGWGDKPEVALKNLLELVLAGGFSHPYDHVKLTIVEKEVGYSQIGTFFYYFKNPDNSFHLDYLNVGSDISMTFLNYAEATTQTKEGLQEAGDTQVEEGLSIVTGQVTGEKGLSTITGQVTDEEGGNEESTESLFTFNRAELERSSPSNPYIIYEQDWDAKKYYAVGDLLTNDKYLAVQLYTSAYKFYGVIDLNTGEIKYERDPRKQKVADPFKTQAPPPRSYERSLFFTGPDEIILQRNSKLYQMDLKTQTEIELDLKDIHPAMGFLFADQKQNVYYKTTSKRWNKFNLKTEQTSSVERLPKEVMKFGFSDDKMFVGGDRGFVLYSIGEGSPKRMSATDYYGIPQFDAKGNTLAYGAEKKGELYLIVQNINNGESVNINEEFNIEATVSREYQPALSNDGKHLFFRGKPPGTQWESLSTYRYEIDTKKLYKLKIDPSIDRDREKYRASYFKVIDTKNPNEKLLFYVSSGGGMVVGIKIDLNKDFELVADAEEEEKKALREELIRNVGIAPNGKIIFTDDEEWNFIGIQTVRKYDIFVNYVGWKLPTPEEVQQNIATLEKEFGTEYPFLTDKAPQGFNKQYETYSSANKKELLFPEEAAYVALLKKEEPFDMVAQLAVMISQVAEVDFSEETVKIGSGEWNLYFKGIESARRYDMFVNYDASWRLPTLEEVQQNIAALEKEFGTEYPFLTDKKTRYISVWKYETYSSEYGKEELFPEDNVYVALIKKETTTDEGLGTITGDVTGGETFRQSIQDLKDYLETYDKLPDITPGIISTLQGYDDAALSRVSSGQAIVASQRLKNLLVSYKRTPSDSIKAEIITSRDNLFSELNKQGEVDMSNVACEEHNAKWSCRCSDSEWTAEQCDASEECQRGLCTADSVKDKYCCSDKTRDQELLKKIKLLLFGEKLIESDKPVVVKLEPEEKAKKEAPKTKEKQPTKEEGLTKEQKELFNELATAQEKGDWSNRKKLVTELKTKHNIDPYDTNKFGEMGDKKYYEYWRIIGEGSDIDKEVEALKKKIEKYKKGDKVYILRDKSGDFHAVIDDEDKGKVNIEVDKNNYMTIDASNIKDKTKITFQKQAWFKRNKAKWWNQLGTINIREDGSIPFLKDLDSDAIPNFKLITKSSAYYFDNQKLSTYISAAEELNEIERIQDLINKNCAGIMWRGETRTKNTKECNELAIERDNFYLQAAQKLAETLKFDLEKKEYKALKEQYKELLKATKKNMPLYDTRVALIRKAENFVRPENEALKLDKTKIVISKEEAENYATLAGYQKTVDELNDKKKISSDERKKYLEAIDNRIKLKNAMWDACYRYTYDKPGDMIWQAWWEYLSEQGPKEEEESKEDQIIDNAKDDGIDVIIDDGVRIASPAICGAIINDSNYEQYVENETFKLKDLDCSNSDVGLRIDISSDKKIIFENQTLIAKQIALAVLSGNVEIRKSSLSTTDLTNGIGIYIKEGRVVLKDESIVEAGKEAIMVAKDGILVILNAKLIGSECDVYDIAGKLHLEQGFKKSKIGTTNSLCWQQKPNEEDCGVTITKYNYDNDKYVKDGKLVLPKRLLCENYETALTINLPEDKKIIIENTKLTGKRTGLIIKNGIVEINGGELNAIGTWTDVATGLEVKGGTVLIKGAKISGSRGLTVEKGTVEIFESEIIGTKLEGIYILAGAVSVKGGTINGRQKGIVVSLKGELKLENDPDVNGGSCDIADWTKRFKPDPEKYEIKNDRTYCWNKTEKKDGTILDLSEAPLKPPEETTEEESEEEEIITPIKSPDEDKKELGPEHASCQAYNSEWSCQCRVSIWRGRCTEENGCKKGRCSGIVNEYYCCSPETYEEEQKLIDYDMEITSLCGGTISEYEEVVEESDGKEKKVKKKDPYEEAAKKKKNKFFKNLFKNLFITQRPGEGLHATTRVNNP
ncbi:hypothetical protein HQ533_05680 [Candidatus Woesearchaeota archaeon]|nr:hypothetical protein [Candidatus Woesearchaeota archaeon]